MGEINVKYSNIIDETITPKETKNKIINLLNSANKSICMSTGLNPSFYNNGEVKTALWNAIKRVKEIKIIITEDKDKKQTEVSWLFNLEKELNGKVQFRYLEDALHWLIIDDKNIRLEKPHPPRTIGEFNFFDKDVPNIIIKVLKTEFNDWWDSAEPFE